MTKHPPERRSPSSVSSSTFFQLIIQMDWNAVHAALESESGQSMAMQLVNQDFALHLAIECKAPESIVISLLHAYPEAAMHFGRLGATPLHLAAQQKDTHPSILVALIRACPEVLEQNDSEGKLPSDFPNQRHDMSREALCRPTACWIEDIEKEEYNYKMQKRKQQLKDKMLKLQEGLRSSHERRNALHQYIQKQLEPSVRNQRNIISNLSTLEAKLMERVKANEQIQTKLEERIQILTNEVVMLMGITYLDQKSTVNGSVTSRNDNEEMRMMKSRTKKKYLEGVQQSYETLLLSMDEIRKELLLLSSTVTHNSDCMNNALAVSNNSNIGLDSIK
jgi:hypothetical protein